MDVPAPYHPCSSLNIALIFQKEKSHSQGKWGLVGWHRRRVMKGVLLGGGGLELDAAGRSRMYPRILTNCSEYPQSFSMLPMSNAMPSTPRTACRPALHSHLPLHLLLQHPQTAWTSPPLYTQNIHNIHVHQCCALPPLHLLARPSR